jgi:hypothetical protein
LRHLPLLFTDYFELHWGLVLCGLLFVIVCTRDRSSDNSNGFRWLAWTLPLLALAWLFWLLTFQTGQSDALLKGFTIGLFLLGFLAVLVERARTTSARSGIGDRIWSLLILAFVPWAARGKPSQFRNWRLVACGWMFAGVLALGLMLCVQAGRSARQLVCRARNFYGVLMVLEEGKEDPHLHHIGLAHSLTLHGVQLLDPDRVTWPTLYYGERSGVGLALSALPGQRRVGLVGLGIGTLATYAHPGDYFRCYEINPDVLRLATSRFSYLSNCSGHIEFALGDARLSLEKEPPQRFDLLALDAFRGDAIPVHLLTEEAFAAYQRHLNTNGIIAIHISNSYVDLEPVLANIAANSGYIMKIVESVPNLGEWWIKPSIWALLTRDQHILDSTPIKEAARAARPGGQSIPLWTDDFSSLFRVLRWTPRER